MSDPRLPMCELCYAVISEAGECDCGEEEDDGYPFVEEEPDD